MGNNITPSTTKEGHGSIQTNATTISSIAQELEDKQPIVERPGYTSFSDYPTIAECFQPCFNCWRTGKHPTRSCPDELRSMADRERLRKVLRMPMTDGWKVRLQIYERDSAKGTAMEQPEENTSGGVPKAEVVAVRQDRTPSSNEKYILPEHENVKHTCRPKPILVNPLDDVEKRIRLINWRHSVEPYQLPPRAREKRHSQRVLYESDVEDILKAAKRIQQDYINIMKRWSALEDEVGEIGYRIRNIEKDLKQLRLQQQESSHDDNNSFPSGTNHEER